MPTKAENMGWPKGVLISLSRAKAPWVWPVTAKTTFSMIANPSPVAAPSAAPYLRFGKDLARAKATISMQTPLEISSVMKGATITGVAQLADGPNAAVNAPFTARGYATPSIPPVTKAIRNAMGTSRSLLKSGGRSRAASFARIGKKKLVAGR